MLSLNNIYSRTFINNLQLTNKQTINMYKTLKRNPLSRFISKIHILILALLFAWASKYPTKFLLNQLQSSSLYIVSNFTSIFCALILTISGCITIYKLYLSQKVIHVNNKTFFKCLFKNLINNPCLFIFKWVLFLIISYCIRKMVFYCLHMYEVELLTYLVIVFSTILPVLYTYHIVITVINFICKPITFAPFLLKNGVVVYVPVFTQINLSIHNKELHSSLTIRNIILVLIFATFGYYFKPLFYMILFYNSLGLSEVEFMSNSTCSSETESCTSSTLLVNYCKESSTSSTVLPNTGKSGSSTTPINSSNNSLTLDITYLESKTSISNNPFLAVIDRLDISGANLKRLYPGATTKLVEVPEAGPGVKGLKFDGAENQWKNTPKANNSSLFKEQAVPDQPNKSSTYIPRPNQQRVNNIGATVLSLGNNIEISSNGRSYLALRERNN